jgi:hypothetical protein
MRLARLTLSPRCLALLLVLALATSAVVATVAFVPATAEAACAFTFWVRIDYYSDPELTNWVGQCYRPCWQPMSCSGEKTEYYEVVGSGNCPPICQ